MSLKLHLSKIMRGKDGGGMDGKGEKKEGKEKSNGRM